MRLSDLQTPARLIKDRGLFITGTDTGVGKTIVTAAIAAALHKRGLRVGVMKPVESGCRRVDGTLLAEDAAFLRAAAGNDDAQELINPYALEHPIAPALAAEQEGVVIDLDVIRAAYQELASKNDIVLVEGAGGLLAPLYGNMTMRDLADRLDLPVLVVAKNVLGVINHAALTVAATKPAGLRAAGIVLNNSAKPSDESVATNGASLKRWAGAPFLGELPFLPGASFAKLAAAAERALMIDGMLQTVGVIQKTTARRRPTTTATK